MNAPVVSTHIISVSFAPMICFRLRRPRAADSLEALVGCSILSEYGQNLPRHDIENKNDDFVHTDE